MVQTIVMSVKWYLGFRDVFEYPSPLPMDIYPEFSAGNTYQNIEIFDFFQLDDINNPNLDSIPVHLSWVRQGNTYPG